jgi:hypothetical protein
MHTGSEHHVCSGQPPVFGPSKLLDFELEMAFFVGTPSALGRPISIAEVRVCVCVCV